MPSDEAKASSSSRVHAIVGKSHRLVSSSPCTSPIHGRNVEDSAGATTGLQLALAVVAGVLTRFVGLGRESIWLDEATSLIIARMSPSSVVAWAAADIHPPLYYLVLHFWLCWGDSEFAVRALSASLGVATVVVVYALACELFDKRVGLLSAFLFSLAPLHVWYSQEARMYVMVTMLSLLASYLLVKALRGPGQGRLWVTYVLVSALALYTHYFALFALLFCNLFALYRMWRHGTGTWRKWLKAQLAVALLFLPWMPILYRQVTTGGGGWVERAIGRPTLQSLLDTWLKFSVGLDSGLYPVLLRRIAYVLLFASLLVAILRVLWPMRDKHPDSLAGDREGVLFCLVGAALPVLGIWLLSQFKPMYSIRYLLVFMPLYWILVAYGIGGLPHQGFRAAVTTLLLVTLVVGNYMAWRVEQNPDWRGTASHVLQRARPGDVVLFSPRWNVKPFEYYNRAQVDTNMDLPIPVTPEAAQAVVDDIAQRYRRVWLVWQRGHYSDPTGIPKQILESRYEVVEEAMFRGVDQVILYELSPVGGS
jgi:mannosyltransferase